VGPRREHGAVQPHRVGPGHLHRQLRRRSVLRGELAPLETPRVADGVRSAWHLYVVRMRGGAPERRSFLERLRAAGLGVQVHYIPVYWHPFYQQLGYRRGECPLAEDWYARAVSLPIFPKMTDADAERVTDVLRDSLGGQ
jgi:dTDP-4-amino-4,6-dideoxygalactose transaminase